MLALRLLLATTAALALAAPTTDGFEKVLLSEYAADGAVCLDGSPAPIYVRPGAGDAQLKWLLYFEGGAWAESYESARKRADTVLGSSRFNATTYHSRCVPLSYGGTGGIRRYAIRTRTFVCRSPIRRIAV